MKLRDIVRTKKKALKRELGHMRKKNPREEWDWPDGDGDGEGDMSADVTDTEQPFDPSGMPTY